MPTENEDSTGEALANFVAYGPNGDPSSGLFNYNTYYTYDATGDIETIVQKDNGGNVISSTSYQYDYASDSYEATTTNGSGLTTATSTGSLNTSTGATEIDTQEFLNGAKINEQDISSNSQSAITDNVSGSDVSVGLDGASIYLATGSSAGIDGNGNIINITSSDNVTTSGANTIDTTINGYDFFDTLANTQAVTDALDDVTFTAPASAGSSVLTLNANGTGTFVEGAYDLSLDGSDWNSIASWSNAIGGIVLNSTNGTSETVVPSGYDAWTATTYSAANGTGSVTGIDQENDDGTSQITNYGTDDSVTTYYTGQNGSGLKIKVDQENFSGTSEITTYTPGAPTVTTYYSGLNGTGLITEIDEEDQDGSSQITMYGPGGSSTTINYGGPDGTGIITNVDIEGSGFSIVQNITLITWDYAGSGISGTVTYDPQTAEVFLTVLNYDGVSYTDDGGILSADDGQVHGWSLVGYVPGATYTAYASTVYGYDDFTIVVEGVLNENPDAETVNYINYDAQASWTPDTASIGTGLTVTVQSGQTVHLGDILSNPEISGQGTPLTLTITGGGTVVAGIFANIPTLTVMGGANFVLVGATIDTDPITIDPNGNISGYGTIAGDETVDGTLTAIGGTLDITGDITGSGTLTFAPGATLQLEGMTASTESLIFTGGGETLSLGSGAYVGAPITGITAGDVISLEGQTVTYVFYDTDTNSLAIQGSTGAVYDLTIAGTYQQSGFYLSNGEVLVACFLKGTRIATAQGDAPVEELVIGELVRAHGAGLAPIKWIGRRHIDCRRHADPRKVWPVRIRADAFGEGAPHSDLWLSPDHAVFIDGVLIQIRQLINGTSIAQVETSSVTYFHVELDRHDVLLAEGLPAESYLDGGNRAAFENGDIPMQLHPEFARRSGDSGSGGCCAPLAIEAELVEPIWQRLASRAAMLGCPVSMPAVTTSPELRLIAAGREMKAVEIIDGRHVFVLPPRIDSVKITSRAAAPTDFRPWLDDRRRLGVSISRIVLRGKLVVRDIPVDHPTLTDGWHNVEVVDNGLRRWTDGSASLPVPAGTTMVEIHVAASAEYPLTEEAKPDAGAKHLTAQLAAESMRYTDRASPESWHLRLRAGS